MVTGGYDLDFDPWPYRFSQNGIWNPQNVFACWFPFKATHPKAGPCTWRTRLLGLGRDGHGLLRDFR